MSPPKPEGLERAGLRFQVGMLEEALAAHPEDADLLRTLAHGYTTLGRHEEGLRADRKLVELLPRDERARYNLACSLALTGRSEEAFRALGEAIKLGFADLGLIKRDPDLENLREDPRFAAIVADLARRLGAE